MIYLGQNWNFRFDPAGQGDPEYDQGNLAVVLIGNFPVQQIFWYTMIFGWLKAAEIIRNPFGNPRLPASNCKNGSCKDMFEELEMEMWKASRLLSNQDIIPLEEVYNNNA